MVVKIISGGQTGADRAGLEVSEEVGIESSGWAPQGWRTELGPDLELRDRFMLREWANREYRDRTYANAKDATLTVWFGNVTSSGSKCTVNACRACNCPLLVNPTVEQLREWLHKHRKVPVVLNVAGNRESVWPGIGETVKQVLRKALR